MNHKFWKKAFEPLTELPETIDSNLKSLDELFQTIKSVIDER